MDVKGLWPKEVDDWLQNILPRQDCVQKGAMCTQWFSFLKKISPWSTANNIYRSTFPSGIPDFCLGYFCLVLITPHLFLYCLYHHLYNIFPLCKCTNPSSSKCISKNSRVITIFYRKNILLHRQFLSLQFHIFVRHWNTCILDQFLIGLFKSCWFWCICIAYIDSVLWLFLKHLHQYSCDWTYFSW